MSCIQFFIFVLFLLCTSCQQTQPKKHAQPHEFLTEASGETSQNTHNTYIPPKLPSSITDELLEEDIATISPTTVKPVKRFNIAAKNISIRDFFQSLVQNTDISIMIHPRVKGHISLSLKKVSFQEVIDLIEDIYGYDIQYHNQIVRIFPPGLKTKTFPVNYLYIKRSGTSNTHVNNSERGSSQRDSKGKNNQGGTSVSSEVNNNFWDELKNNLESIIGEGKGRKVVLSPQASLVTVKAYPSELRQVEQFLNEAVAHLKRQVILEAKIIEVQLDDSYSQGIQWNYILGANNNNNKTSFDFANSQSIAQGFTFNIKKAFNNSKDTFSSVVKLLATQGDVDVLSSPRITTSNNQKAVIKVGEDKTFAEGLSNVVITDKDDPITQDIITNVYFSGISLDVTPQINAKGEIILHVHPSIVEVEPAPLTINAQGGNISFETAKSKIRESDTIIKAESGDVIIIGGLMQTKQKEKVEKVPLLGDIPFLGELFTYRSNSTQKTELFILLKPEVVNESTWKKNLEQSKKLLKKWDKN